MPIPEAITRLDRLLMPGPVIFAETIPEAPKYRAYVNFGGLLLTVEAPCGCKMHYDTSELAIQAPNRSPLEACMREECEFEYAAAEEAALTALGEFNAHGPDYDIGGES